MVYDIDRHATLMMAFQEKVHNVDPKDSGILRGTCTITGDATAASMACLRTTMTTKIFA